MKAVISKIDLVNLIGKIQSIVAAKPAIPILSNVLIEAIDDQLIVSATDLTVSMRCYVEAKVIEEGSIALPARFFSVIDSFDAMTSIRPYRSEIGEAAADRAIVELESGRGSQYWPEAVDAFARLYRGQDYYNLSFLTDIRVLQLGVTTGGERMPRYRIDIM